MQSGEEPSGAIAWLKVLLSTTLIVLLSIAYFWIADQKEATWTDFLLALLPNIIVVLIIYMALYLVLERKGIGSLRGVFIGASLSDAEKDAFAEQVATKLAETSTTVATLPNQAVLANFRQVPWGELIEKCRSNLQIVVYYCDTWISQHYEDLARFASKPNTTISLYLANVDDVGVLEQILQVFPGYDAEALRSKVRLTKSGAQNAFAEVGASLHRVHANYYPRPLQYSMFVFDDEVVVAWLIDMNRKNTTNSPAFMLDLSSSEDVARYFAGELQGIKAAAVPMP